MYNYKLFLEKVVNKEDLDIIYDKYYKNIDKDIFNKIVSADPTSLIDNKLYLGKFSKWLLKLYKDKKLLLEDLYKATKYLTLFNEFKFKIKKDINTIKSLPELYLLVKDYDYEEKEIVNEDEQKLMGQFKEVFKNDKYRIIIPLTLEASKYFGRNTEWCTTNTESFKQYTKKQNPNEITRNNLYILYTDNLYKRLQFHFKKRQFMNIYDEQINIEEFFEENKDIFNFFNKYFYPIYNDIVWNNHTLIGAPEIVYGNFNCRRNYLKTLEGSPKRIYGDFDCSYNYLETLKYSPIFMEDYFNCSHNILITLEGSPKKIKGDF